MNEREDLHIPDRDGLTPELTATARLVRNALRAEVPSDVVRRHEVLLRSLAATPRPQAQAALEQTGDVVALSTHRRRSWRSVAVLAAVLVLVLGTSAMSFADDARPGDRLYALDRALERVELLRAGDPEARAQTHLSHAAERSDEARSLAAEGRSGRVEATAAAAADSLEAALDESSASRDPASMREQVLSQMSRHLDVLTAVRDRLASGSANESALRALDRVIQRTTARYAAFQPGSSPQKGGPPEDPGTAKDQDKPGSNPEGAPGNSKKPEGTGGGSKPTGTGAGRPEGVGGGSADRGGGPPADRPRANPRP